MPGLLYTFFTFALFVLGKTLEINYTINYILRVQKWLKVGLILLGFVFCLTVALDAILFGDLDNGVQNWSLYLYLLVVHGLIFTASFLLYQQTMQRARMCHRTALTFHDFLINYKATPRSRLLRKHMPQMEAIVESQSQFEQSQQSVSVFLQSDSTLSPKTKKSTMYKSSHIMHSEIFIFSDESNHGSSDSDDDDYDVEIGFADNELNRSVQNDTGTNLLMKS